MEEQMTNQSTETTEAGFDDLFAEESSAEPTAETKTETAAEPFMKVKYNGAEQGLSQEEAITYAQKGMNYDKIYGQLEQLRNDPTRQIFEAQAQRAGLTLPQYAERLNQFQAESEKTQIANDFKRKNPDVTDEVAQQYAEAQYQSRAMQKQAEQAQAQQKAEADKQADAIAQIEAFQKEYPNVDIRNLPVDVVDSINAGETLLSAYRAHENREMRQTIEALRKNKENESVATGGLSQTTASTDCGDPFLAGLLG